MSDRAAELIARAEEIIANPDRERFQPVLLLELMVEILKQQKES